MKKLANGRTLAFAAWASVFALAWGMAIEMIPMWPAGWFFVFFVAVGGLSSTTVWNDGKEARKKK